MATYLHRMLELARMPIPEEVLKQLEEERVQAAARKVMEATNKATPRSPVQSSSSAGANLPEGLQKQQQLAFQQAMATNQRAKAETAAPAAAASAGGGGACSGCGSAGGCMGTAGGGDLFGACGGDMSFLLAMQQQQIAGFPNPFQAGFELPAGGMGAGEQKGGQPVANAAPAPPAAPQNSSGRPQTRERPPRKREPHDPKKQYTGTITKWDDDAGFGFISSFEAYKVYGKDVFVHKAQIGLIGGSSAMYAKRRRSEIRNGDTVTYTVDLENPGKPRAYNVFKVSAGEEGQETEEAKRRRLEAGLHA